MTHMRKENPDYHTQINIDQRYGRKYNGIYIGCRWCNYHCLCTPMYKRQVDPISFPKPDCRDQYSSPFFFLMKILFWSPDPLNKGKLEFLLHFWALWGLYYKNTSKNSSKTLKNNGKCSSRYQYSAPKPQKCKYFPPPLPQEMWRIYRGVTIMTPHHAEHNTATA